MNETEDIPMTFKAFCTLNNINYETARKYRYRHPELSSEQILEFYNQPQEQSFSDLCKKLNINYKKAYSFKQRHPELTDEQVILYYRPDIKMNIFGELVIPTQD